jgi:hypothetical protein
MSKIEGQLLILLDRSWGGRWEMTAPLKIRGKLVPLKRWDNHEECFPKFGAAVHRAFNMRRKAVVYENCPIWVKLPDGELYHLEDEQDAVYLKLRYDFV